MCPICLANFPVQEIGTPDTCDHIFCAKCIEEWSHKLNRCPIDRLVFKFILVRHSTNGEIIRRIPVGPPREEFRIGDNILFLTFCTTCGKRGWLDRMLTCPGCDFSYHFQCLKVYRPPPEWLCPMCISTATI
jgi:PHD and RING finger domain-containing protein 1